MRHSYIAVGPHDDQDVHDNHDGVPCDVEVEPNEEGIEADDYYEHNVDDVPDEVDHAPDHHPLVHVLRNGILLHPCQRYKGNYAYRAGTAAAFGGAPAT